MIEIKIGKHILKYETYDICIYNMLVYRNETLIERGDYTC